MSNFIAKRIEKEADKSLEDGRAKYYAYFGTSSLYAAYRPKVDEILTADGYEDVIWVS